ncbi:hypothetical protein DAPPUDRAFT_100062 [Daphnia pulex]|uniref:Uncharacterized protein n=1 Tax=Daphnia pulex TaxID=6669 RepID=E9G965_DAPPU|nr:hypothetical protein DAPPUDRAFT_100062 [Daphnia pulex]|eukprot:EFX84092.1 hypothetical protein DAPPUDRAFT_100062 [Daphnia pulex]
MWSNAVSCCEFHFYGFVIMNFFSVLLRKACASSLRTQKYNLSYFTDELEHFSGRFRAAVTHLQSLTTGLCPGNAEETSRRWTLKHLRYLQNVSADHHLLLVIFVFVLVNPLSATPLFSPSSLARAS